MFLFCHFSPLRHTNQTLRLCRHVLKFSGSDTEGKDLAHSFCFDLFNSFHFPVMAHCSPLKISSQTGDLFLMKGSAAQPLQQQRLVSDVKSQSVSLYLHHFYTICATFCQANALCSLSLCVNIIHKCLNNSNALPLLCISVAQHWSNVGYLVKNALGQTPQKDSTFRVSHSIISQHCILMSFEACCFTWESVPNLNQV